MRSPEEVVAWVTERLDRGEGSVVRGDDAVARALAARLPLRRQVDWLHDTDGLVVFADAPGHLEQAALSSALVTMGLSSAVVVLTGEAHDAAPPAVGEGHWGTAASDTTAVLGVPDAADVDVLEAELHTHADRGDLLEATVRWRALQRRAPHRAAATCWVELRRLLRSGRRDEVLTRALALPVSAEARERVLLAVATARYLQGEVGPWLGQVERLVATSHDDHLVADAQAFVAYVRQPLPEAYAQHPPATAWQRALAELGLVEEGHPPGPTLRTLPGRLGEGYRAFVSAPLQAAQAARVTAAAGHPCDAAVMVGALATVAPYREAISSVITSTCASALLRGDVATATEALSRLPPGVRRVHDVWSSAISTYDVLLHAAEGDRAAFWSALLHAEARFPTVTRRGAVRFMWRRFEAMGRSPDPWMVAKVAGFVLDRLVDDDLEALSSRALPTLPTRPLALGPYALEEPLASGGMGTVWRATHAVTDDVVAVKVLRKGQQQADEATFAAEVELTSRLEHPGIVAVLDHGMVDEAASLQSRGELVAGQPYLVMEFVGGGTLTDYLGALPYEQVHAVATTLLDALAYAHARGVLHRDLKPDNVLVTERGEVRLTDFGLSAFRTDRAAGTPYSMAPEQYLSQPLDPRTDLYGLGCLLWQLLTGRPPFQGTLRELQAQHLSADRPPLRAVVEVPDALESWLHSLFAASRSQRPPSAAAARSLLPGPASGPVRPPAPRTEPLPGQPTSLTTLVLDAPWGPAPSDEAALGSRHGVLPEQPVDARTHWAGRPHLPSVRMARQGDPPLRAHREEAAALWQALCRVQQTGRAERVELAVPWGSIERLVDELVLGARVQGAAVADTPTMGALAVVPEGTEVTDDQPWLTVAVDGSAPVRPADALAQLEAVAQRLVVDRPTAVAAARAAWGHPALVGTVLAQWAEDPGYRLGEGGLQRVGEGLRHDRVEGFWRDQLAGRPRLRSVLALLACLEDGAPRHHVEPLLDTAGCSVRALGGAVRWWGDRMSLAPDLRRWLRREHAADAPTFHDLLASLPAHDAAEAARVESHRMRGDAADGPTRWVHHVLAPAYDAATVDLPAVELAADARLALDARLQSAPTVRAWLRLRRLHAFFASHPERTDRQLAELVEAHPTLATAVGAVRWQRRWSGGGDLPPIPVDGPVAAAFAALCASASSPAEAERLAHQALAGAEGPLRGRVASVLGRHWPDAAARRAWLEEASTHLPPGRERSRARVALALERHLASLPALQVAAAALADDPGEPRALWLAALHDEPDASRPGLASALSAAVERDEPQMVGRLLTALLWITPLPDERRRRLLRWASPVSEVLLPGDPVQGEQPADAALIQLKWRTPDGGRSVRPWSIV